VLSILFGRNLDRKNAAFPDMPPFHGLPDDDVAAVATYVRTHFGAASGAISPATVRALRESPATTHLR
jgi:mono/diheme cytochrome c family protein